MPKSPIISIVVAVAENQAIGLQNQLPWHIPEDLEWFKRVTMGKPIIMGRNTFESIGRPLPGRRNMVISSQIQPQLGIEIFPNLDAAIASCSEPEICVIGGVRLFEQALNIADRLYYSAIKLKPPADRFFPELDWTQWREVSVTPTSRVDFKILDRLIQS